MEKENDRKMTVMDGVGNNNQEGTQVYSNGKFAMEIVNFSDLVNGELKPLDFVIDGFVAGTIGLLTGVSGIGKTNFALQLAFALADTTKQLNFLDLCNDKRGKVVYIAVEDDNDILRYKISIIWQYYKQKFPNNVHQLSDSIKENLQVINVYNKKQLVYSDNNNTTEDMITNDHMHEYRVFFNQISEGKKLIIIDSFWMFYIGNKHSIHYMHELLSFFKNVATKNNCAVLFVDNEINSNISGRVRYHINLEENTKNHISTQETDNIKVSFPKANYVPPMGTKWLNRVENGVMEEKGW